MHPFNKPISELALADIEALIQNGIPESRMLDYKRDMYGGSDAEKREFLCDVSAFANTMGGYLIIGVHEEEGIPKAIISIAIEDVDKLQLRFENLLRTAVDPAIRGVEFEAIDAGDSKYVMVIEIPRSISRPHAVDHQGHWRFYGRNSVGKYPYEVDDVRRAVLQSETLAVRIRNFRNDRLSQISVGDTPVPLPGGAKIVLHLIPVSSFELGQKHDVSKLLIRDVQPISGGANYDRMNFDGCITYLDYSEKGYSPNYTQVFHNGIIEAVDTSILEVREGHKTIPLQHLERSLARALQRYLGVLHALGAEPPLWICLSLLNVKGYAKSVPDSCLYEVYPVDRPELLLPEIYCEDPGVPTDTILKPAFEFIWNACGEKRPT